MYLELFHIGLAMVLLIILNVLGASSLLTVKYTGFSDFFNYDSSVGFNAILRILAPSIFTVLISIALYALNRSELIDNIWHVAFYYAFIQALLVFLVLGRGKLVKKSKFFLYHALAIALTYWVYTFAIIKGPEYLLPDEANFRTEIWFIIILFLYGIFTHLEENRGKFSERRRAYVSSKLTTFKNRYEYLIEDNPKLVKNMVYALMIYEDYVRPKTYRLIEQILAKFDRARTTGIMQVSAKNILSDEDSIKQTIQKLNGVYSSFGDEQEYEKINRLIATHNTSNKYLHNVYEIYELVNELQEKEK